MAIGFSPKHQQEETIQGLTKERLMALTIESINALEWKVSYISQTGVIAYTSTSIMVPNQEITIKFTENLINCLSKSFGSELFDMGKNKKNVARFFSKLKYLKEKVKPEDLDIKYNEISSSIISGENDLLNQPPKTSKEGITDFFSLFIPKKEFFVTPVLIDLNLILFIVMVLNGVGIIIPDNQILIQWGGKF